MKRRREDSLPLRARKRITMRCLCEKYLRRVYAKITSVKLRDNRFEITGSGVGSLWGKQVLRITLCFLLKKIERRMMDEAKVLENQRREVVLLREIEF